MYILICLLVTRCASWDT